MSGGTPQHAGMVLGEVEPGDPADLEAMEPALACCYFVLSIGDQGSRAVRKGVQLQVGPAVSMLGSAMRRMCCYPMAQRIVCYWAW